MTSFIGNIKNAVIRFNKKIMEAIISWEFTMGWQAISTSSREVHVVNFFVSNMSNSTNMVVHFAEFMFMDAGKVRLFM
jgi:hypothetical protein